MGLIKKFKDFEKGRNLPKPLDLSNPDHRKAAQKQFHWGDHAILRYRWTNFYEMAPGVYRSNQPNHDRWVEYQKLGLRTVINLRGRNLNSPPYEFERESLDQLGIRMVNIALGARSAPPKASILTLLETFQTIEKPFLMHCKSGADRAGLASVLYMLLIEKAPIAEARKMLSFRFLHIKWSATGILDFFLDAYEARLAQSEISFEDWIRNEYDEAALTAAYKNGRKLPL